MAQENIENRILQIIKVFNCETKNDDVYTSKRFFDLLPEYILLIPYSSQLGGFTLGNGTICLNESNFFE